MRALQERVAALADAALRRRVDRIAEAWRGRGLRVKADASSVTVEGMGLARRLLGEFRFEGGGR